MIEIYRRSNHIFSFLGAYVPLTREGNIIVDRVLASCYASTDHTLAHLGMKPLQWFPEMIQWLIGEDNEEPVFVRMTKELCKSVMPAGTYFQK